VDGFAIQNKALFRTSAGTPGTDANRILEAQAVAAHVLYNFTYNKLVLSPGLRYENILSTSLNYGNADVDRTGANLVKINNRVDVFIPGMGALYKFNDNYTGFASLHKGFSPPGAVEGADVENSINYEAGFRFTKKALSGEIIGFYNDFSNLQGADTNASGGTGTGDLFNAGKAEVNGVEVLVSYNILNNENSKLKLPITATYTFTNTELKSNFASGTEAWGEIEVGDEIPYIPKNLFAIVAGLEYQKFTISLSGKYTDEFRTVAGQGPIPANQLIKSNFIVDASAKYFLTEKISLMTNLVNILDKEYAVSRVPSGLRPGMPFGINFGITAQF
jgi:Fe(3+) dicitrate transport protein